jgi:hypothetical protein
MRPRLLLLLVLVAGCPADDGYAVDLTVKLDAGVSDDAIATLTRLHLVVSGQESYVTDVDATGKFAGRASALRYKPGAATSGTIHFAITAFAGDRLIAAGMLDVTLDGSGTRFATVTLLAVIPEACGNGTLDPGETCDDGSGSPTPCPHALADCDDGNACTTDSIEGSDCQTACTHTPLAASSACTMGGAMGICIDGACCTGCIAGGQCQPGSAPQNCGTAGNSCFDCTRNSASSTCDSGQCSGCDATSCTTDGRSCGTSSCGFNCGSCPDSCANAMLTHYKCDKSCQANDTTGCPGHLICASATACKSSCAGDGDCIAGHYCNAGSSCVPKQADGGTCTRAGQCSSGICADGYCCNATCSGACEACNLAGRLGACTPVASMQPAAHGTCASDGSSCGGYCNGIASSCTYPTGTCGEAPYLGSCSGGKCNCPTSAVFCASNGNRCTSKSYNEYACGTAAAMCSGSTPACYSSGCAAVGTHFSLATGFNYPHFIAQDANYVYFTDTGNNTVIRQFKGSGNPLTLVTAPSPTIALATDGTNVYYGIDGGSTGSGSIWKVPVAGGTATKLVSGVNPWLMAADSNYAYWSDYMSGTVKRVSPSGTVLTLASSVKGPNFLVSDGTYLYWANGGSLSTAGNISRVLVNGSAAPEVLIAGQNHPYGIAIDSKYVYWSNSGTSHNDASVWKMPLAGGVATPLMQNMANAETVRVDDVAVYVGLPKTGIWKIPLCGSPPVLIVNDTEYLDDIVVDDSRLFYTRESAGDVQAATK